MPDTTVELNTTLTPQQMAKTKREADYINQQHKANGKSYGEGLGKDSFLKLLVTELTHQDPTKPMNDREFIAQMAQFSSLEQMNNVNEQMTKLNKGNRTSEAYSLIGKEIESLDADTGRPIRGTVSHVVRSSDAVYLSVGKHQVRLEDVHAVYPAKVPVQVQQQAEKAPVVQESPAPQVTTVTHETAVEAEISGQESTSKGMRNSFNNFQNIYDTNSKKRAQEAYLAQ